MPRQFTLLLREIKHSCNFSNVLIAPGENVKVHALSKKCQKAIEDVSKHQCWGWGWGLGGGGRWPGE